MPIKTGRFAARRIALGECAQTGRGRCNFANRSPRRPGRIRAGRPIRPAGCAFEAEEKSLEHFGTVSLRRRAMRFGWRVMRSGWQRTQSRVLRHFSRCYHARSVYRMRHPEEASKVANRSAGADAHRSWPGARWTSGRSICFIPGALTVNCAITRYASCSGGDGAARVAAHHADFAGYASAARVSRRWRRSNARRDYQLPLLAQLVRFFRPRAGFTLTTNSEAPAGAGIGGSSAMAVAICAALDRLHRRGAGPPELDSHQPGRGSDRDSTFPRARRIITRRPSAELSAHSSRSGRRAARGTGLRPG